MGLTQHKNAVATIQEIMNFLLLGGNIGRPGAGPCPVRGHSNVQGDRTMGVWERMNDKFMKKLGDEFRFTPPKEHGHDTVETIKEMHRGHIRVFFAMGGNFLAATPDTEYTAKALRSCRLTAHVATKLNRSHLITGETALILPCLGRSEIDRQADGEQFVTVEDSMGIINPSRGVLEPASEHLLSEPAIVAGLAAATLGDRSTVDWKGLASDYNRIRDHIERVIPGFERFNERIAHDVFYLPNDARDHRKFNNDEGKAKFTVHPIPRNELAPGRYIMMTIRSHDQFNTHIYGLDDRYRGIYNGRRVIFMNAEDMKEADLQQGEFVDLTSHYGEGEERTARHFQVAPYLLPRGCTATYFPEANVLVPINSVAERSNTPTSKFVIISIAPARTETGSLKTMASNLSARGYVRAVRNAPRGGRLAMLRALLPFVFAPAPKPVAAGVCEFSNSLEEYPSTYARLAPLLGRPEQRPASGEIEFLRSIQNRAVHYVGAIGTSDYLFLTAVASILAPVRAVEIGTSSGFSSAILAAALHRRHPQIRGPLVDTIDFHSRYLVDQTKPIGFEIPELLPQLPDVVRVHTSRDSDFVRELARRDELAFVFIDADHQHPWPVLDLLRVAPFVRKGGWILLHDIQLGAMGVSAREKGEPLGHGAPFGAEWLFERWPFPKITGGNIGAVQLPLNKTEIVPTAVRLMALPFEMDISSHRRMRHALSRVLVELT